MKTKQALFLFPIVEHFYNPKSLLAKYELLLQKLPPI